MMMKDLNFSSDWSNDLTEDQYKILKEVSTDMGYNFKDLLMTYEYESSFGHNQGNPSDKYYGHFQPQKK